MDWLFNMDGSGIGMLIALVICFLGPLFVGKGKKNGHTDWDKNMKEAGFRKKFINGKWYWVPKSEY